MKFSEASDTLNSMFQLWDASQKNDDRRKKEEKKEERKTEEGLVWMAVSGRDGTGAVSQGPEVGSM